MDPEMFPEDNFNGEERANELLNTIDNIEQEKKEKKKKQETTMKKSSSSSSNANILQKAKIHQIQIIIQKVN